MPGSKGSAMAILRSHRAAKFYLLVVWATAVLLQQGDAVTFPADTEALFQLISSVEPSSISFSSCLGSWDFSYDPCEPQSSVVFVCGFSCEVGPQGQMRVTRLILDYGGYAGTLSSAIGNLSALQEMDVSGNAFRGPLPRTLGRLSMLRHLDVSNNALAGQIPGDLGLLSGLQYLSLANNGMEGHIPFSVNNLLGLTELYINGNRLSGPIPDLRNLGELRYFDASGNRLSGHLPYGLPTALVRLSLRDNQIAGQLPRNFNQLKSLAVLDLAGNQLRGQISYFIFLLPALQQLNMSHNSFSSIGVPNMAGVGSVLLAIDASFNLINGTLPVNFGYMQHLHSLALGHNLFHGDIPELYARKTAGSVPNVDRLDRLFLDGNYLTGDIPTSLLSPVPDLTGSLVDNCLRSCPSYLDFCQGGKQRSPSECGRGLI